MTPGEASHTSLARLFGFSICLGLAVLLHWTHLDRKPATHDEVYTGLRVSGHSEEDLVRDLSRPRLLRIGDVQARYQAPNADRTVRDMVRGIAAEEPQFPPLYFIMVRAWARTWGGTLQVLRGWSAFCMVLALPCLYWLSLELFQSQGTAAVAVLLLAVSPFFFLYSQDARHYPLWALTVLLASAVLLRALRTDSGRDWILYAASLVLTFYTCVLSVLVAAGHVAYVVVIEKGRLTRKTVSSLLALLAASVCFLPWAGVMISNRIQLRKVTGGVECAPLGLSFLSRGWIRVPGRLLYPLRSQPENARWEQYLQYGVTAASLALVVFALVSLVRRSERREWAFVLLLIASNAGGLALQDLARGGQRLSGGTSSMGKYLTPYFLGVLLALAHLFSDRFSRGSAVGGRAALWRAAVVAFGLSQAIACLLIWNAERWSLHEGDGDASKFAATALINRSKNAAVVTGSSAWDVLYLSQTLNPEVRLWTRPTCYTCGLKADPTDLRPDPGENFDSVDSLFLFPNPTPSLVAWAKEQSAFELQDSPPSLPGSSTFLWLKRR